MEGWRDGFAGCQVRQVNGDECASMDSVCLYGLKTDEQGTSEYSIHPSEIEEIEEFEESIIIIVLWSYVW